MAQKTNPNSLRLQKTNKHFSSCWYSDFFYEEQSNHELKIRSYLESVTEQVNDLQNLLFLQTYYKRSYIYFFFLDMRAIKEEREKVLKKFQKNRGIRAREKQKGKSPLYTRFQKNSSIKEEKTRFGYGFDQYSSQGKKKEKNDLFVAPAFAEKSMQNLVLYKLYNLVSKEKKINKSVDFAKKRYGNIFVHKNFPKSSQEDQITSLDSQQKTGFFSRIEDSSLLMKGNEKVQHLFRQGVVSTCWKGTSFHSLECEHSTQKNNMCTRQASTPLVLEKAEHTSKKNIIDGYKKLSKVGYLENGDNQILSKSLSTKSASVNNFSFSFLFPKTKSIVAPIQLESFLPLCATQPGPFLFSTEKRDQLESESISVNFPQKEKEKEKEKAKDLIFQHFYKNAPTIDSGIKPFLHTILSTQIFPHQDSIEASLGSKELVFHKETINTERYAHTKTHSKKSVYNLLRNKTMHSCLTQKELHKRILFQENVKERGHEHPHHFLSILPIRVMLVAQNALFIVKEFIQLLQKGVSFRQIKDILLRDLEKNEIVKGVRFSCSGRVGGRSKKAQKTKIQSIQWGETSLHVFSSKVSFAKGSAHTPFGVVGIKVWVCFK